MFIPSLIFAIIISYLIGSIPFAVILSKIAGLGDITKTGSGNPGATNMLRHGGKKLAAINLILDAGKGALAAYLFGIYGLVFAVLGHCFSVFLKFKGGKGVATYLGGLVAFIPILGLLNIGLWLLIYFAKKISSLSALISINLTAILGTIFWFEQTGFYLLGLAVLITYRHKSNIQKLLAGSEK